MQELITKLKQAEHCVVFTGAGASTLSGIRDFRGKNGIYTEYDAEKVFSIDYFIYNPAEFYKIARTFFYNLDEKEPNIVHAECARLEHAGMVKRVITQNIDMLHQKAGSKDVIEVHGSPITHSCLDCGRKFSFVQISDMLKTCDVPCCDSCNGLIKPDVTFFGEPLPAHAIESAVHEARSADLLFILGTTLVVYPAASLPMYTLQNGGEIVIVNNQPTPFDSHASLRYESLEEVFEYIRKSL